MKLKGMRVKVQLPAGNEQDAQTVEGTFIRFYEMQCNSIRIIKALVLMDNGDLIDTYINKIKFIMKGEMKMELTQTVEMM